MPVPEPILEVPTNTVNEVSPENEGYKYFTYSTIFNGADPRIALRICARATD